MIDMIKQPINCYTGLKNLTYFSDEAIFHKFGYVHTQNYCIWRTEKPIIVCKYQDNTEKNKRLMYNVFEHQ